MSKRVKVHVGTLGEMGKRFVSARMVVSLHPTMRSLPKCACNPALKRRSALKLEFPAYSLSNVHEYYHSVDFR